MQRMRGDLVFGTHSHLRWHQPSRGQGQGGRGSQIHSVLPWEAGEVVRMPVPP